MNHNNNLVYTAAQFIGLKEVDGPASDPTILAWIREVFPGWGDDSTLAWCSVFMIIVARMCGLESTLSLPKPGLAQSWLRVGEPVELENMKCGDVAIWRRGGPGSGKGHIGIFMSRRGNYIYVLGGNQSNGVRVSRYPLSSKSYEFLGARRLRLDLGDWPANPIGA